MKAMIFAAGLGTRLKPLTNDKPKALVEIGGKTLLERCISYLKKYGVVDVVINVHHFSKQVKNYLTAHNNFGVNIQVSDETNELLDTGGGVLKAKSLLDGDGPILIINVDILTDLNLDSLLKYHIQNQALASLVVRERTSSRYLLFNNEDQLIGWENSKTGELKKCIENFPETYNQFAFSGIHVIQPTLLNLITEKGKFSIIDLYLRLATNNSIKAYLDKNSIWMDLGKYDEIETAEILIQKMRD